MERTREDNAQPNFPQGAELYTGSDALMEFSRKSGEVVSRPMGGILRMGIEAIVRRVKVLKKSRTDYCITAFLTDD